MIAIIIGIVRCMKDIMIKTIQFNREINNDYKMLDKLIKKEPDKVESKWDKWKIWIHNNRVDIKRK